jgi:hypothetical protein
MAEEQENIEIDLSKEESLSADGTDNIENVDGRQEDIDSQIRDLKNRLDEERRARQEAEVRAREAMYHAEKATNDVDDANLHVVSSAINTVKREQDILKAHLREAMSVGDYDKAAELQSEMSTNAARLLQLENGKSAMENRPQKQPVQPMARQVDPVEDFASRLSSRSAAWIRSHPQCVTDQRLMQKMIAAHNLAVADGYEPDSDDYFGVIEDTLKMKRQESRDSDENPMSEASAPTQRRVGSAPPAAAPVARAGNGTGTRSNVVRLTSEEREMAEMMGMKPEDYAKNKMALIKSGKMSQH